jgi:hypothetical protein
MCVPHRHLDIGVADIARDNGQWNLFITHLEAAVWRRSRKRKSSSPAASMHGSND